MLHRLQLVLDRLDDRHQVFLDEQDLVFRVVEDIGEMMQGKPEVRRVQHRPHAGNAEIQFKVALVVQRDARHPVAPLDAERFKGVGELAGPFEKVPVGVAEDAAGVD